VQGRVGFKGYTKEDLVDVGEGAYTIGGKHITTNVLNLDDAEYISWDKYYESPEIMVNRGDIVFAQRGTLGKAAYIDKEIGAATINPSLVLIKNITANAKYLHWYLISSSMLTEIDLLNTSTAVPMISQFQINNICTPNPPLNEQQAIADYLDKKCGEIDELITIKQQKIESLKEYKKSVIYEYVTGKKEV
jgi:type I restriction enzyme S subunit